MKNKKYVIMCVGRTHTGKTTFAKEVVKKFPAVLQIDSDEIAVFAKEKYPSVVESDYNKTRPDFKNLKMVLFKDVYTFGLNIGLNIILSNSNLSRKVRSFVSGQARKHGYQIVTVYFNLPEEVILKRLHNTRKSDKVFIQSKTWAQVLERQRKISELPPSKRNTIYFEITNNNDEAMIMEEIGKLL